MGNKSVSLFEVLPPKGNKNPEKKGPPSSENKAEASPAKEARKSVDTEPPKSSERKNVDEPSFGSAYAASTVTAQTSESKTPRESSSERDLTGVSVQKREDHFWLIALIMVGFSIVIGVACYRYGYKKGVGVGFRAAVAQQESPTKAPPASSSGSPVVAQPSGSDKPSVGKKEILPTRLVLPTDEMKKAVSPPVPLKRFTLQVQTMGRNQKKSTDALVAALRQKGFDAFADYRHGAVFVGRLEKSHGKEADDLKKRVSRFNYHNLNLQGYFRPIPKHLLEN